MAIRQAVLDAFDQQYMKDDDPDLPNKIAKIMGIMGAKLAFPGSGLALEILLKVAEALFDRDSTKERVAKMWEMVKSEFEHVETTRANHGDVQRAIQLAFAYDSRERNDEKRIDAPAPQIKISKKKLTPVPESVRKKAPLSRAGPLIQATS